MKNLTPNDPLRLYSSIRSVEKDVGDENYEKFLELRTNQSMSDEQFAHAVFTMPLLHEKQQLAARVLASRWRKDWVDDAMQDASLRVYCYFSTTRGMGFSGHTNDSLGGWLYALVHQHAGWALHKIVRAEQRRRAREVRASRSESQEVTSASEFAKVLDQTFALFEKLPAPLSNIAFDLHYGVPVNGTAKACGISERRVYELRAQILTLVSDSLDEMR